MTAECPRPALPLQWNTRVSAPCGTCRIPACILLHGCRDPLTPSWPTLLSGVEWVLQRSHKPHPLTREAGQENLAKSQMKDAGDLDCRPAHIPAWGEVGDSVRSHPQADSGQSWWERGGRDRQGSCVPGPPPPQVPHLTSHVQPGRLGWARCVLCRVQCDMRNV